MDSLKTLLCDHPIEYDGTQLTHHWIYRRFNLLGNAVVCFEGKADVALGQMVDVEDVKKAEPIFSPRMLHFIAEWFIDSFELGIAYQHLFIRDIREVLGECGAPELRRTGDDLYCGERKLSVSIATRTPVSVLMHTGLNIETRGTPIPTAGLADWDLQPMEFAKTVMERFSRDWDTLWKARCKVSPR